MVVKSDRFAKLDTVGVRRDACGYRIQEQTCASCVHCARHFRGKGHDEQMIDAECEKHDFPVNLDRGICDDFRSFAAGWKPTPCRRRKTITRRTKNGR